MNQKQNHGLKDIRTFITADGLLAVTLTWTQLWIQPYAQMWPTWYLDETMNQVHSFLVNIKNNIGIGLSWTFLAIFLALLGLGWVAYKNIRNQDKETPDVAIGLFIAAVILSILEVGQGVFVSIYKTLTFKYTAFPLIATPVPNPLVWVLMITPFIIIILSIWGVHRINTESLYKVLRFKHLPWLICAIYIALVSIATVSTMILASR